MSSFHFNIDKPAEHHEDIHEDSKPPHNESILVSNYPHAQANTTPMISPDNFHQWLSPPYVLVFYFLAEVFVSSLREFMASAAYYDWGGTWWASLLVRSIIMGAATYMCVLGWAQWTGAYGDMWITVNVGLSEIFFGKNHRNDTTLSLFMSKFSVLGKVLVMLFAQFIGTMIGQAIYAWCEGIALTSSDCDIDSSLACHIAPRIGTAASESIAMRYTFLGNLIIAASYFQVWCMLKRITLWVALVTKTFVHSDDIREAEHATENLKDDKMLPLSNPNERSSIHRSDTKYVPWQINDDWSEMAKQVGMATLLAHLICSNKAPNAFNYWTWFVSAMFTGDFSGGHIFAWPGLMANLLIFVILLISHLLARGSANYRSRVLANARPKMY